MAERELRLRYRAVCVACETTLTPGTRAWWDSTAKKATCGSCHGSSEVEPLASAPADSIPAPPSTRLEDPEVLETGKAGASARRQYDKKASEREANIRSRFPRIGGAILAVFDDPQSTKAWGVGASGERLVGERLDAMRSDGVLTLHDRRVPRSRANIDHISVGPAGIHLIDTKNYTGRIESRDVGGWFRRDDRLYVNGRDRTVLAEKVGKQAEVVRAALGGRFDEVTIRPYLCFAYPDLAFLARPFLVRGAVVTWPRAVQKQVAAEGPLDEDAILVIARHLAERLPPA